MPLDGFTVARDDFDTVGAVSVGSGGPVSGSMLWLSPMDGSARGFVVETQHRRNADRLILYRMVSPVGLVFAVFTKVATFGYKTSCSGRFE